MKGCRPKAQQLRLHWSQQAIVRRRPRGWQHVRMEGGVDSVLVLGRVVPAERREESRAERPQQREERCAQGGEHVGGLHCRPLLRRKWTPTKRKADHAVRVQHLPCKFRYVAS